MPNTILSVEYPNFSLDKIDITKLWSNFKGDWDMLKQSIGAVKDQTTSASQALKDKGKRLVLL
jgi:hypothetical protein